MAVAEAVARALVVTTARKLTTFKLSPGRSGNVSMRFGSGMLITPTGLAYDDLSVDDIVVVCPAGTYSPTGRKPSSEWQFHLSAYAARPDRHGLVHTHSLNATALACAHRAIPAFHYMVAAAGGNDIPLVPYATFGTDALARHVASGLKHRDACLLANHGVVAMGPDLNAAFELACEVESLAEQYIKVLALGAAHILPDEEMAIVIEKFKTYGQRAHA